MEKMKSLADQLREEMVRPTEKGKGDQLKTDGKSSKKVNQKPDKIMESAILNALLAYDNSEHKNMVHIRFDKQTVDVMNKFKMATNVDVTKFVAFAVKHFFETYPEIKLIIKQFIQNTDL